MNSFNVIVSSKAKRLLNQCWKSLQSLEDDCEDLWKEAQDKPSDSYIEKELKKFQNKYERAYQLLNKEPDLEIGSHDHCGFYPPKLLKTLRRKKVFDVVFVCPDDEDIFLFFGSEDQTVKRLKDLNNKIKKLRNKMED